MIQTNGTVGSVLLAVESHSAKGTTWKRSHSRSRTNTEYPSRQLRHWPCVTLAYRGKAGQRLPLVHGRRSNGRLPATSKPPGSRSHWGPILILLLPNRSASRAVLGADPLLPAPSRIPGNQW